MCADFEQHTSITLDVESEAVVPGDTGFEVGGAADLKTLLNYYFY